LVGGRGLERNVSVVCIFGGFLAFIGPTSPAHLSRSRSTAWLYVMYGEGRQLTIEPHGRARTAMINVYVK
jgi:hypothetical protein